MKQIKYDSPLYTGEVIQLEDGTGFEVKLTSKKGNEGLIQIHENVNCVVFSYGSIALRIENEIPRKLKTVILLDTNRLVLDNPIESFKQFISEVGFSSIDKSNTVYTN